MNSVNSIFQFPADGADVSPSDVSDLPKSGVLYIGTGGNVKVDTVGGTTLTYKNLLSGAHLPVRVKKVYATGTTAADMICNFDKF